MEEVEDETERLSVHNHTNHFPNKNMQKQKMQRSDIF